MPLLTVSYSRIHRDTARNLVDLLRAAHRASENPVFWDEDLRPGDVWRDQIRSKIEECDTVLLVWCCHAVRSEEVTREYQFAQSLGRTVVPVLIDSTPLPADLAHIHAVDLRQLTVHDPPCTGERPEGRGVNLRYLTEEGAPAAQKMAYLSDILEMSRQRRARPELVAIAAAFDAYF